MQEQYETRKLPKKTIIWISLIIAFGVSFVLYNSMVQSYKIENILKDNGYKNISNVKVYASHDMVSHKNDDKGVQFTISFDNNDTKKHCKGFIIIINHTNRLIENFDCK
jgi:hypothetical protein